MMEILKIFLSMSLSGSLLILLMLAAKPLFRGKTSRSWQYYIWLLVIARLLLPISPEGSMMSWLFSEKDEQPAVQVETPAPVIPEELPVVTEPIVPAERPEAVLPPQTQTQDQWLELPTEPVTPPAENDDTGIHWAEILQYLWFIWPLTAGALFLRKVCIYRQFLTHIRQGNQPVEDVDVLNFLSVLSEDMGIRSAVELSVNPRISTPMLVGFFRAHILLPDVPLSEGELRYTLLHELTHLKRRDMFYKWLVQLTLCVHWFNPLVYVMEREISRCCELSCDEAVIAQLDSEGKRAYGNTLIHAASKRRDCGSELASVTLSESGKLLKERLGAILSYRKMSKSLVALMLVLTMLLAACGTALGSYGGISLSGIFSPTASDSMESSRDLSNWNISHAEEVASSMDYGEWLSYAGVKLKLLNSGEAPTIEVKLASSKDVLENTNALFAEMEEPLKEKGAVLMNLFDTPRVAFRCTYGDGFHYEWVREDSLSLLEKQSVKTLADDYRSKLSGTFSDDEAAVAVKVLTFPEEKGISLTSSEFKGYALELNFTGGSMDGNSWKNYLDKTEVRENLAALTQVLNLSWVSMNYDNGTVGMNYFVQSFEIDSIHFDNAGDEIETIKAAIDELNSDEASDYSGGTVWSPVATEEYLSLMTSDEIENWLNSCSDPNKAYALKYNTEYKGLKRTQWLLYYAGFGGQDGSEYDTGVDYGFFSTAVKADFHPATEEAGKWFLFIHHTDDSRSHKGKLKVSFDGKAVDCIVTDVDFDLSYLDEALEQYREEVETDAVLYPEKMMNYLKRSGRMMHSFEISEARDVLIADGWDWYGFVCDTLKGEPDHIDADGFLWRKQETVEAALEQHLDIDGTQLRSLTEYYNADLQMYRIPEGWDPVLIDCELYSAQRKGDLLYVKTGITSGFDEKPFLGISLATFRVEDEKWSLLSNTYLDYSDGSLPILSEQDYDNFVDSNHDEAILPDREIGSFMDLEYGQQWLADTFPEISDWTVLTESQKYILDDSGELDPYRLQWRNVYKPHRAVVLGTKQSRDFDRLLIVCTDAYHAYSQVGQYQLVNEPHVYCIGGWEKDWQLEEYQYVQFTYYGENNMYPSLWNRKTGHAVLTEFGENVSLNVSGVKEAPPQIKWLHPLNWYRPENPHEENQNEIVLVADDGVKQSLMLYEKAKEQLRPMETAFAITDMLPQYYSLENYRLAVRLENGVTLYDLSQEDMTKALMNLGGKGNGLSDQEIWVMYQIASDNTARRHAFMYYVKGEDVWRICTFDDNGNLLSDFSTELPVTEDYIGSITFRGGLVYFVYYPEGTGKPESKEEYAVDARPDQPHILQQTNKESANFRLGVSIEQISLSEGDSIGGWTLDMLEITKDSEKRVQYLAADFRGEMELKGTIRPHSLMEYAYEFVVSEESRELLPSYVSGEGAKDTLILSLDMNAELLNSVPAMAFGEEYDCTITASGYRHIFAYMMAMDTVGVTALDVGEKSWKNFSGELNLAEQGRYNASMQIPAGWAMNDGATFHIDGATVLSFVSVAGNKAGLSKQPEDLMRIIDSRAVDLGRWSGVCYHEQYLVEKTGGYDNWFHYFLHDGERHLYVVAAPLRGIGGISTQRLQVEKAISSLELMASQGSASVNPDLPVVSGPDEEGYFPKIEQTLWDQYVGESSASAVMPTAEIPSFLELEDGVKLLEQLYPEQNLKLLYEHRSYTLQQGMYDPYNYVYRDQYEPTWVLVFEGKNPGYDRVILAARREYWVSNQKDGFKQPKQRWENLTCTGWEKDWQLGDCNGLTPMFGTSYADWAPSLWFTEENRGLLLDNDGQEPLLIRYSNALLPSVYAYADLSEYVNITAGQEGDKLIGHLEGLAYYDASEKGLYDLGGSGSFLTDSHLMVKGNGVMKLYDLRKSFRTPLMTTGELGRNLMFSVDHARDWAQDHVALFYCSEQKAIWNVLVFDLDGRIVHNFSTGLTYVEGDLENLSSFDLNDGVLSFTHYPQGRDGGVSQRYRVDMNQNYRVQPLKR